MTAYNVVNAGSLVAGEPEDISVILANLQAIAAVINGGLDDSNLNPAASIVASKLALYPADATKFLRGDGTWNPTASYGTTLPASPADGQEAILVDSLTNPTYQWRFRYNAGSSSPYKWEFIGGAPLHADVFADETWTPTSAWTDTTGPRIVLPRAGDYHATGGSIQMTNVQDTHYMGLFNGTITQLGMYTIAATAANTWSALVMSAVGKGLAAATDIRLRHQHGAAGTAHAQARWLDVVPVRVS